MLAGCKTGLRQGASVKAGEEMMMTGKIEDAGIEFSLPGMRKCHYPVNDPLFAKKKNKKLVLLQVQLRCLQAGEKIKMIPGGAVLTDSRGNEYESSPAVIAMAQTSQCIGNDDIGDYNAIWNGDIHTGENYTAWVLGFELPEDAVPEKLYWNRYWKNRELYFDFHKMNLAINH